MDARKLHCIFLLTICCTLIVICGSVDMGLAQNEARVTQRFDEARELLRAGQYGEAARGFERIERDDPEGELAAQSLYWMAFALQREGGRSNLRKAAGALTRQFERFPDAARRGDSGELAVQIQGDLARLGDAKAAARIATLADEIRESTGGNETSVDGPTRIAALNALMHMSPEKAVPILRKILREKPDAYPDELREKAVFIVSQHGRDESGATLDLLTYVIANDRSVRVREKAVFWIGQTGDPRVVSVLTDLLRRTDEDPEIREKAIFALSQFGGPQAHRALREVALDREQPARLREKAVFWISQNGDRETLDLLIEVFEGSENPELIERSIFSAAQIGGERATNFLLSIVRNRDQRTEHRKQALFWLGQSGKLDADAVLDLFRSTNDVELQEQAVFVLSQLSGPRSVDALMEIARSTAHHEMREKAIFWLGQSNDARAAEFLAELIAEEF